MYPHILQAFFIKSDPHQLLVTLQKRYFILLVLESVCPLTYLCVQAKRDQRMAKPLSEVVREVSKKDIEPWVKAIVFELCCNDTEGEDVEVRARLY